MNSKGFTLVELLAVIVILAVIIAITVPAISNIITNARKSSFKESAQFIFKSLGVAEINDSSFDPASVDETNIETKLGINGNNYNSVAVSSDSTNVYIEVTGKNQWSDYKACGTKENILVVDAADTSSCLNGYVAEQTCTETPILLSDVEINAGSTHQLTSSNTVGVTWSSSNDTVAIVSDGLVTGIAGGTATIQARNTAGTLLVAVDFIVNDIYISNGLKILLSATDYIAGMGVLNDEINNIAFPITFTSWTTTISKKSNGMLYLTGSVYLRSTTASSLFASTTDMTIEVVASSTNTSTASLPLLVSNWNNSRNYWIIGTTTNIGSGGYYTPSYTWSPNVNKTITIIKTGQNFSMYVDGVIIQSGTSSDTLMMNYIDLAVNRDNGGVGSFNFGNLRTYNRAISISDMNYNHTVDIKKFGN